MYRDEETLEAIEYLREAPRRPVGERDAIVLDPMLATGNSSVAAIEQVKRRARVQSRSSAWSPPPKAIEKVHRVVPDVHVVCAARDRGLNDRGFIVPGPRRRGGSSVWDEVDVEAGIRRSLDGAGPGPGGGCERRSGRAGIGSTEPSPVTQVPASDAGAGDSSGRCG